MRNYKSTFFKDRSHNGHNWIDVGQYDIFNWRNVWDDPEQDGSDWW